MKTNAANIKRKINPEPSINLNPKKMMKTKTIQENEVFKLSSGDLFIKSIAGDAHLTTIRISQNDNLIAYGQGEVEVIVKPKIGDIILIVATINKPITSSPHASLTVEMNDQQNSDRWKYTSYEPDYEEVIYEVTINLI
ncbi:MAG: hypothetical protein V1775_12380 [Bacteroidota bacterium]